MKHLLITVSVLVLFCSFGNALKCFKCDSSPCQTEVKCTPPEDTCLLVKIGERNISRCWKPSDCTNDAIEKYFQTGTFKYRCCQKDLCNSSPVTTYSKTVLGIAALLTVIWIRQDC